MINPTPEQSLSPNKQEGPKIPKPHTIMYAHPPVRCWGKQKAPTTTTTISGIELEEIYKKADSRAEMCPYDCGAFYIVFQIQGPYVNWKVKQFNFP